MCIMSSSLHGKGLYQVCRQSVGHMRKTRAVIKCSHYQNIYSGTHSIILSRPPEWEYIDTTLSVLLSILQAYSQFYCFMPHAFYTMSYGERERNYPYNILSPFPNI